MPRSERVANERAELDAPVSNRQGSCVVAVRGVLQEGKVKDKVAEWSDDSKRWTRIGQ